MTAYTYRVCILFLSLSYFFSCEKDEKCCDCMGTRGTSDKYEYPIVPGTPEWSNLKTGEAMYNVCQIPPNTLKNMCTIGLVDSWLTYPLRTNIGAWDTPQIGFQKLTENFNGLSELLGRSDVHDVLFDKYKNISPSGYSVILTDAEKGRYAMDYFLIEITIAQYEILEKMSQEQRVELMKVIFEKRTLKLSDEIYHLPEDTYATGHPGDVYIMTHIMIQDKYEPFMTEIEGNYPMSFFAENCQYIFNEELANLPERYDNYLKIIRHAENYINN